MKRRDREQENSQKERQKDKEEARTETFPCAHTHAHTCAHTYAHTRTARPPLKAEGQGLAVPGMCVAARLFHRSQNSLMRLWPLLVGTLLPGLSFDKVDGPSGTSYQVFLFLLLNPAVVLLFHGKQSEAKVSGLCPWGAQAIPSRGRQRDGRSRIRDAGPGREQWVRRGLCWLPSSDLLVTHDEPEVPSVSIL